MVMGSTTFCAHSMHGRKIKKTQTLKFYNFDLIPLSYCNHHRVYCSKMPYEDAYCKLITEHKGLFARKNNFPLFFSPAPSRLIFNWILDRMSIRTIRSIGLWKKKHDFFEWEYVAVVICSYRISHTIKIYNLYYNKI